MVHRDASLAGVKMKRRLHRFSHLENPQTRPSLPARQYGAYPGFSLT
jgi:hypothetical protein